MIMAAKRHCMSIYGGELLLAVVIYETYEDDGNNCEHHERSTLPLSFHCHCVRLFCLKASSSSVYHVILLLFQIDESIELYKLSCQRYSVLTKEREIEREEQRRTGVTNCLIGVSCSLIHFFNLFRKSIDSADRKILLLMTKLPDDALRLIHEVFPVLSFLVEIPMLFICE